MKIALINENSQAAKNSMIESVLKEVVDTNGSRGCKLRHVLLLMMRHQLTYVQVGILDRYSY